MTRIYILLSAILIMASKSHAQGINYNTKSNTMLTTQKNEEIVRQLFDQALNKRNLELLKDLISEDYLGFQGLKGAPGFERTVAPLINAFPDIQYKVEDLFGEADKVAIRWKWQGTHKSQFNGFSATGKITTNEGIAIFRLKDGKVISADMQTDRLGFLQQLGVVPQDLNQQSGKGAPKDHVNLDQ